MAPADSCEEDIWSRMPQIDREDKEVLKTFSITDTGRKRKLNQDVVYASAERIGNLPNLFVVADGMGGHKAGDLAAKMAVEILVHEVAVSQTKDPIPLFYQAVKRANESIRRVASEHADMEGMGTTVVAATLIGNTLQVVNVGDSRLYIVGDKVTQITRDHSLVEEMVRMGGLAREAARKHPDKNIITRAVGAADLVEPDFFTARISEKDIILLCSDGLTNMLEDEEIGRILQGAGSLEERARQLVDAANENGGGDNISVVLAGISAE